MVARKGGIVGLVGLVLWLGGCASPGPVDNPVGSVLTWFSYVGGEDIRAACHAGAPETWRMVYNGDYLEQVRAYDLTADPVTGGAVLQARVTGPRNLLNFNVLDPFRPWAGTFRQKLLNAEQTAALRRSLIASGFDGPAPTGTFLRSDGYYWAVSACRGGTFHFNAWQAPEQDVAGLAFVPVLLQQDENALAYNLPRKVPTGPFGSGDPTDPRKEFQLEVGRNGLVIGPRLR